MSDHARQAYFVARRMWLARTLTLDDALDVYRLWIECDQREFGSRAIGALVGRERDRLTGYVPPRGEPYEHGEGWA